MDAKSGVQRRADRGRRRRGWQKCSYVPKEECKTIKKKQQRQDCRQVPRKKCRDFPKRSCRRVPKRVAKRVPKETCRQVLVDDCYTSYTEEAKETCKQVGISVAPLGRVFFTLLSFQFPKRTCQSVPREVKRSVPVEKCEAAAGELVCARVGVGRPKRIPRFSHTEICTVGI